MSDDDNVRPLRSTGRKEELEQRLDDILEGRVQDIVDVLIESGMLAWLGDGSDRLYITRQGKEACAVLATLMSETTSVREHPHFTQWAWDNVLLILGDEGAL